MKDNLSSLYVKIYRLRLEDLERESKKLYTLLPAEDKKSCDAFKFRADYLRRLGSAYLMQRFVGKVTRDECGKPRGEGICFNVSHGGAYVVMSVAPVEVGVDIEEDRPAEDDLYRYVSSESEYKKGDFFEVWTLKESLLKCVGTGIVNALPSVPAYPIGRKVYDGRIYFCRTERFFGHVLSLTLETERKDVTVEFVDVTP
ncbi:MAG: 4'-phosphopantetheinyl transferase superfamily protein [Clostridia bacterium]|nr:4'-phosphopantetheinyl transferase superfamily protein [Clostridia bacterium]